MFVSSRFSRGPLPYPASPSRVDEVMHSLIFGTHAGTFVRVTAFAPSIQAQQRTSTMPCTSKRRTQDTRLGCTSQMSVTLLRLGLCSTRLRGTVDLSAVCLCECRSQKCWFLLAYRLWVSSTSSRLGQYFMNRCGMVLVSAVCVRVICGV